MKLSHKFVKNIPDAIESAVLYISTDYSTIVHKCCCGCGSEIVTPLSPTDWKLTFDGKTISLYPSIGNWSLRCQSHYWITNSEVEWAPKWSRERIERGRKEEKRDKETYYKKENPKSLFGFFFKK
jgi:hypothetical protein